jgi:hypothetical protein
VENPWDSAGARAFIATAAVSARGRSGWVYPRPMAGNPAGADRPPQVDARDGEPDALREREGPVMVDRHRMDDGRALILYTRAPSKPA